MNAQTATGTVHRIKGYTRQGSIRAVCGTNLGRYASKTEAPVSCGKCDPAAVAADDFVARDREETDSCEVGTPGCSVSHTRAGVDSECAPW